MDTILATLESHNLHLSDMITTLFSVAKYNWHFAHIDLCLNSTKICQLLQNQNSDPLSSTDDQSPFLAWAFHTIKGKYKKEVQDLI